MHVRALVKPTGFLLMKMSIVMAGVFFKWNLYDNVLYERHKANFEHPKTFRIHIQPETQSNRINR